MAFRRGGTPLTGALPSLEASNQAQIDDLVQRNRTLEHAKQKLAEEVAAEQQRGKDAVLEIQRKWEANERLWKEGCEDVLRSYRIVQKQLQIEVEVERGNIIKEMAITREEKLQRLKRDYKIKQFQMREQELELTIEDLEAEKMAISHSMKIELEEAREKNARYAAKLKEAKESYQSKLESARAGLRGTTKAREDKEAEFNELRKEHSTLESNHQTMERKFQKTLLQLEHVQGKLTDFERLNHELRRTNADLTNQIERWQNLETKGGEAAEQQQRRNQELELRLQEIEEEREEEREQSAKELAKERKRMDNLKGSLTNWEVEAKEQKKENSELEKKIAKLEKTCTKLKADLEVERARVRPPSPQKPRVPSPPPPEEEDEEEEEEEEEEVIPLKKAPSIKKPAVSKSSSSTKAENTKAPLRQVARKSTGGKPPPPYTKRPSTPPEVFEISDHEVAVEKLALKTKRKGKSKASEPEEVEEIESEPERRRKGKGKRKAGEDEDVEDAEIVAAPTVNKKVSKTTNEAKEPGKTKVKRGGSKQPSARPGLEEKDDEDDAPDGVKKKKRKIIPSFAGGPFAFSNLALTKFDDTLNIPSMLSPLKVDDHVPQRSTSSNLSGLSKLRR